MLSPETAALLEDVERLSGRDFRGYAEDSRERVLGEVLVAEGVDSIDGLRRRLHGDAACLARTLRALSVPATALFRDPAVFRALRELVVPHLATYPSIRVWIAGCASGEEAWSVAVLLREAGLLERSTVYATDLNQELVDGAHAGRYAPETLTAGAAAWTAAGGGPLATHLDDSGARFAPELAEHLVFAVHDLGCDAVFNDFQLILCRNVMIYFDHALRARATRLLIDSLAHLGVLGLGAQEALLPLPPGLRPFDPAHRLYRRRDAA